MDIKQDRGIDEMDTEQNNKTITEALAELAEYLAGFEEDMFNSDIKNLQDAQELIKDLQHKNKFQADEIELLRQTNDMYQVFLSFQKGINVFAFIIAVGAFILSCLAFLSTIR